MICWHNKYTTYIINRWDEQVSWSEGERESTLGTIKARQELQAQLILTDMGIKWAWDIIFLQYLSCMEEVGQ